LRLYKVFRYCVIFRVTEPEGGRTLTYGRTHTHTHAHARTHAHTHTHKHQRPGVI